RKFCWWMMMVSCARLTMRDDHSAAYARAVADPALDLERPLLGPHLTLREGDAALDRAALALCRAAPLLPAALIAPGEAEAIRALAQTHDLTALPRDAAEGAGPARAALWREAMSAPLPIAIGAETAAARLRVMRREGRGDEHYALEIGAPDRAAPVVTRLHSACLTGDLFGSLKCDCGPQLRAALQAIAGAGGGVLIYLQQEGRGIGLTNKLRAYRLQEQGFDTVEANLRLGFRDDERLLRDGGDILAALGFRRARLLTNNPKKLEALESAGVEVVERLPLVIPPGPHNEAYLRIKADKSGHLL
ncbi:MAG: GTP cyclohydrolase II, partial [Pseudomonadota bacterium]